MASRRFSTIWGGASLLQMLLSGMREFTALGWEWDFMINLSESDFPIKSLENLEKFLGMNKGLNFVKSHGREVQRFIKKQGLDKTFIECDSHMWRVGERKLPRGVVVDGGSDWVALSPAFAVYLVGVEDDLLSGLDTIFRHTLLPAESYFHTVLRNTKFCNTYVDNNLHVTNWKRKLGCKCQYRHVVDWCGCSPNDFRTEDWPRIQSTHDRQLFFARKFEPIINQEIITRVERSIGVDDHYLIRNLDAYWQSVYNSVDVASGSDDILLTHALSVTRHNAARLRSGACRVTPGRILEIHSYHYADVYKGNLILHEVFADDAAVTMETWYKPKNRLEFNKYGPGADNVKTFKVGCDYDQKEQTFRNLADVMGPLSEPVLLYDFSAPFERDYENVTAVWSDPAGDVARVDQVWIQENNLTNFIKPDMRRPLLPGVWKVALFGQNELIVQTKFLIIPSETSSARASDSNLAGAGVERLGPDLLEWIDRLHNEFYSVLGSCVEIVPTDSRPGFVCGQHTLDICSSTDWSSLSPDPKGQIGKLNKETGLLDRI